MNKKNIWTFIFLGVAFLLIIQLGVSGQNGTTYTTTNRVRVNDSGVDLYSWSFGDVNLRFKDGLQVEGYATSDVGTEWLIGIDSASLPGADNFKVKISTDDTPAEYLEDQVTAGVRGLTLVTSGGPGDEVITISNTATYTDVSGNDAATDFTGTEAETLTDGSDASALHLHTLDTISDPAGNTAFTMANKQIKFTFQAPAVADGGFEIEASGGFSGDLVHIHQHTGNPSTVDLVHMEATDTDVLPLRVVAGSTATTAVDVTGTVVGNNGAVFNEVGGAFDFRVEGDTNINLFHIDASSDEVGIGTVPAIVAGRILHVLGNSFLDGELSVSGSSELSGAVTGSSTAQFDGTVTSGDSSNQGSFINHDGDGDTLTYDVPDLSGGSYTITEPARTNTTIGQVRAGTDTSSTLDWATNYTIPVQVGLAASVGGSDDPFLNSTSTVKYFPVPIAGTITVASVYLETWIEDTKDTAAVKIYYGTKGSEASSSFAVTTAGITTTSGALSLAVVAGDVVWAEWDSTVAGNPDTFIGMALTIYVESN